MTDEEITRVLAEKVMEYRIDTSSRNPRHWYRDKDTGEGMYPPSSCVEDWAPLACDLDACAVLDKMSESADIRHKFMCHLLAFESYQEKWLPCNPNDKNDEEEIFEAVFGGDRRRRWCTAALKAVGAWEE